MSHSGLERTNERASFLKARLLPNRSAEGCLAHRLSTKSGRRQNMQFLMVSTLAVGSCNAVDVGTKVQFRVQNNTEISHLRDELQRYIVNVVRGNNWLLAKSESYNFTFRGVQI